MDSPGWHSFAVLCCHGIRDTRDKTVRDYDTLTLAEVFALPSSRVPKDRAAAIIPSLYTGPDARSHAAQEERGRFVAICADIDKGNHALDRVERLTDLFFGVGVARRIYSTASATPDGRRWRVIVPLAEPLEFAAWHELTEAFHRHMAANAVEMDASPKRAGQLSFLPNVPPDSDFFFETSAVPDGAGASLNGGSVPKAIADLRMERRKDAAPAGVGSVVAFADGPIAVFNRRHRLSGLLTQYGYAAHSNGKDWRSPHQTSDSYATQVRQGDDGGEFWVSLSESDRQAGLGAAAASGGCFGDAFDLFAHFEHGGDRQSALDTLARSTEARQITASPFVWRQGKDIRPRPWLIKPWLLKGTVACVVAPGGTGKSTFVTALALSVATGRELLDKYVIGGGQPVWVWNLEDDLDELSRSIQAAAAHHGLSEEDFAPRLFVDSALDGAVLCTAVEDKTGFRVYEPVFSALTEELKRRGIKVLIVDPFISSHAVDENSNSKIDKIVKAWARVAKEADCAIILVHHTSKAGGQEVNANSARGASALVSAARSVLAINRMSPDEASRLGIPADQRRRYVSVQDDKHNRAAAEVATWFELKSQALGNGDDVGVMVPWIAPEASELLTPERIAAIQAKVADGAYRANSQAADWVGHAIAPILNLGSEGDKSRIKLLVNHLIQKGSLVTEHRQDPRTRKQVPIVVVGTRVSAFADAGLPVSQPCSTLKGGAEQGGAVVPSAAPPPPPPFRGVVEWSGAVGSSEVERRPELFSPPSPNTGALDGHHPLRPRRSLAGHS